MPKNTFFNLPEEKRNKIIQCAKNEFSKSNFYDASINQIIKEAGVSRGSFYQYFEDKEDLFIYLLDEFKEKIKTIIKSKMNDTVFDIFEIQLIIFDYLTHEGMESEDRDFIISFITNLNLKFGSHLMKFIDFNKLSEKNSFCFSDNMKNNFRISTSEEFMALHSILMTSLTNELTAYFLNLKDLESCRRHLVSTSNILKYGIIKN